MPNRVRQKTFTGCLQCRRRKVKCGGERPRCVRCNKIGIPCPGYDSVFIWVPPNQETSKSQGLGGLPPEITWKGRKIYGSEELDQLIMDLTNSAAYGVKDEPAKLPFSVLDFRPSRTVWPENMSIPRTLPSPDLPGNMTMRLFHHYVTAIAPKMMPLPIDEVQNPWRTYYPRLAFAGNSKLHQAVLYAILSQSAAHLLHLGCEQSKMKVLAIQNHTSAINIVRETLAKSEDFDFEALLASILSLIMAEVYDGSSSAWRYHLSGAWQFALRKLNEKPWLGSEMAWLTTQSLCLLRLRTAVDMNDLGPENDYGKVQSTSNQHFNNIDKDLIRSVSVRSDFGFTMGASSELMACLNESVSLILSVKKHPGQHMNAEQQTRLENLTVQLNQMVDITESSLEPQTATNSSEYLSHVHNNIFALGLLIFLHRHTLNPPPRHLLCYTSRLFQAVNTFHAHWGNLLGQRGMSTSAMSTDSERHRDISGFSVVYPANRPAPSITLWPVFMGAVECYRPEELIVAHAWLASLDSSGIGNRVKIKMVVEEVWRQRHTSLALRQLSSLSSASFPDPDPTVGITPAFELGDVVVDWRQIMKNLGYDVLLV